MCGIAGVLDNVASAEEHHRRIQAMTATLRHRGPDGDGIEVVRSAAPAVLFGHRRLAIIDLSSAGRQPMVDPETGNWITFNGEIYNYRELRNELLSLGQIFRTNTDTEVILKAFGAWGQACFRRLRGIFALGLWRANSSELLLVRDHLGVKPLYYWSDENHLLFASEVRSLLTSGLVPRRIHLAGLQGYLAYGSLQEPLTLVEGVRSLPPAHLLTWRAGEIAAERYWHLPTPQSIRRQAPADVDAQTRELLTDAVQSQLVSDVPLGAFLSGGIDSTAIAALAQTAAQHPIKTFSIVFNEKQFDESSHARSAAEHIGSDHTEVRLTGAEVLAALPDAISSFDQPSVDGINTYFVSRATRQGGLTVALSGVGGDELFGGYGGYRKALTADAWASRLSCVPKLVRHAVAAKLGSNCGRENIRQFATLMRDPAAAYFATRRVFSPWQVLNLAGEHDAVDAASSRFATLAEETLGYDLINRTSALELQTYMLSTLLRDTDQMSMAHALEVRVPLLDYKLVEYVFALPGPSKLASGRPKPLLTRPLGDALPHDCVFRPKRGFELPFAVWLQTDLREHVEAVLFDHDSDTPLLRTAVSEVWELFNAGRLGWSRVWTLYVLIEWLREHRLTLA